MKKLNTHVTAIRRLIKQVYWVNRLRYGILGEQLFYENFIGYIAWGVVLIGSFNIVLLLWKLNNQV